MVKSYITGCGIDTGVASLSTFHSIETCARRLILQRSSIAAE